MRQRNHDAIAKIKVGERRGTAFLVAQDHVLTALHNVAKIERGTNRVSFEEGEIQLYFPDFDCIAEVVAHGWCAEDDWVILKCTKPVPNSIKILGLGDLKECSLPFWTHGFPNIKPDGITCPGEIINLCVPFRTYEAVQLLSPLIAAINSDPHDDEHEVGGLSGAPVILDKNGTVVGIVRAALGNCSAQAGTVFATSISKVLSNPTAKKLLVLDHKKRIIDVKLFQKRILKELERCPDTIDHLDAAQEKLSRKSFSTIELPTTGSKADLWVYKLMNVPFDDASDLLCEAVLLCVDEKDDTAKEALLNIVFWFVPVAYDRNNAVYLRDALDKDDIGIVEAGLKTALAVEFQMACAFGRRASFRKKIDVNLGVVGENCIPIGTPQDIIVSPEDGLLNDIDNYLQNKFGKDRSFDTLDTTTIRKILEKRKDRGNIFYVLFGGQASTLGLDPEKLKSLAKVIGNRYRPLATLLLSDDKEVNEKEAERLEPICEILEKALYHE